MRAHILHASELRQAALSYVGKHCSDHSVANDVTPQQLMADKHLDEGFNDHGATLSMNLANYPHALLETEGNSRFKVYLDSLDMGEFDGIRRQNRFSPDTGVHRVANAGLNFMLINGYKHRCEAPATRAELWDELCAGLERVPENAGMSCTPWNKAP